MTSLLLVHDAACSILHNYSASCTGYHGNYGQCDIIRVPHWVVICIPKVRNCPQSSHPVCMSTTMVQLLHNHTLKLHPVTKASMAIV